MSQLARTYQMVDGELADLKLTRKEHTQIQTYVKTLFDVAARELSDKDKQVSELKELINKSNTNNNGSKIKNNQEGNQE